MALFPDKVLTEIFSYLPAKSVARFRALSRPLRAALSSASFVELHLRRANKPGELKVFFSLADDTSEEEESCGDDDDDDDDGTSLEEEEEEESYFYAWQPGGAATKLTPSNFCLPTPLTRPLHGLVLIRCIDTGYHVFNPCTGAALALPDSKLPEKMLWRPPRRQVVPPSYLYVAYGLGYCSVTGEYKAVRLFSTIAQDDDEYSPNLCQVFVLDTLAYWRPSVQQPPACIVEKDNPGVFLDGSLHFLCRDGRIVAFDVNGEKFSSVLPPPNPKGAPSKMTELDGWTEPERVQLDSYWIAPLGMYNKDNKHKKITFDTGTCKVFAVDVPNGNTPEVIFNPAETIGGIFQDFCEPSLGLFEESLVPVGRTIEEMVLSSPHTKAWFNILKWMPTQSVADLSLVCRAWHAMVKDDHFIRSQVAHANLNKSPRIMMINDTTFGGFVDLEDVINGREGYQVSAHLVCSQPCHGLNAGTFNSRSFVCNPVRGHVENIVLDGVDDNSFFAGQTGLGYDSEKNKHMLVLLTYKEKNLATREYQLECKLRYVDEHECLSVDPPRPVADVTPTYVDGKIFWLVEPNLGPISLNCEILAFDIDTEEFKVLRGPPCSSDGHGCMSILGHQGALCVACSDKSSNVIDIWMMKDVGIWSMGYHIDMEELSPEYSWEKTTPLAVDPMDGRILLSTGQSIGYYDPKMAAMETLYKDVGLQSSHLKFCPVICDESFIGTLCDKKLLGTLIIILHHVLLTFYHKDYKISLSPCFDFNLPRPYVFQETALAHSPPYSRRNCN